MARWGLLIMCAALTAIGCAPRVWRLHAWPPCADGLPVQLLTDPRCPPDSICGYSCCPDRWRLADAPEETAP